MGAERWIPQGVSNFEVNVTEMLVRTLQATVVTPNLNPVASITIGTLVDFMTGTYNQLKRIGGAGLPEGRVSSLGCWGLLISPCCLFCVLVLSFL